MAKKILIIEDNQSFGLLVSSQLQKAGFETRLTPDAMLGIKEATQWRPDLALLDLMLPAGGGLGVLRSLRRLTPTQNLPVLIMTGSNDPTLRKQVLELGVQTILQKPYKPEELIALIHQTLGTTPAQGDKAA
jgi:DNA-binding response OmpR family regulator